jgi:hypothetical protein
LIAIERFHPKHSDTTLNLIAIERFHPMISSNILPNILPKKIYIAFEQKINQKKNIGWNHFTWFWFGFVDSF